jgi:protein phosphatase
MGSTLAALYLDGDTAVGCNVGDSRIYLYRSCHLRQISTDHTTAQMLVNMGALSPEQARSHPGRRVLRQHIGIFEEELTIMPSFTDPIALQHGDVFLLCSAYTFSRRMKNNF